MSIVPKIDLITYVSTDIKADYNTYNTTSIILKLPTSKVGLNLPIVSSPKLLIL